MKLTDRKKSSNRPMSAREPFFADKCMQASNEAASPHALVGAYHTSP
jgi:hypothetical protein